MADTSTMTDQELFAYYDEKLELPPLARGEIHFVHEALANMGYSLAQTGLQNAADEEMLRTTAGAVRRIQDVMLKLQAIPGVDL
jgi:hypothetical protein